LCGPRMSSLRIAHERFVQTLTLARPEKRNALDGALVAELHDAVRTAAADPDTRVLVLAGEGAAFCAGADLEYLRGIARNSPRENEEDSRRLMEMLLALRTFPKPSIAKVRGPALAGGCGLAIACDIVVAEEGAQFGFTEVRIGFVPAIVAKLLVERAGMGAARELLVRGNIVHADTALDIGLANYVVGAEELDASVERLAREIAERTAPQAVALTKELLLDISRLDVAEAMRHAVSYNVLGRTTGDFRKGIEAYLTKEKPRRIED
jgi:methylglutaconyl-CoA hydratase